MVWEVEVAGSSVFSVILTFLYGCGADLAPVERCRLLHFEELHSRK